MTLQTIIVIFMGKGVLLIYFLQRGGVDLKGKNFL